MDSVPFDHQTLRTTLENAGLRCTPQRLAVYDHLSQAVSPSHRRGRLSGRPRRDSQDQPGHRLQGARSPGRRRRGDQAPRRERRRRARYDPRRDLHYHFRCLRTGTVHDLPTRFDPDLIAKLDPVCLTI